MTADEIRRAKPYLPNDAEPFSTEFLREIAAQLAELNAAIKERWPAHESHKQVDWRKRTRRVNNSASLIPDPDRRAPDVRASLGRRKAG